MDYNGFTTKQFYDADNQVTASVDAYGNTSYQAYDANGNVTEAIDGDGNTTYTDYDANGNVTATVDGRGYTSFTYYDADGNVTASVDQDGDTTQYQFDADGNQTAVIDSDLNTTTMAYDGDNRLTETISPSAGTSYQYYDADGNVTETIAANGGSIITSYDADDRVTHAVWYESSFTVDTQNKTYDNDGLLLTASNVNGTYSFSYDPDGQVTQVSEPFGQTLNYAYDGDGNQTQVVDSFGGTETSVYDVQDRLVTREYTGEGENLRVDFTCTANNQIATETDYYNLAGTDLVGSTTYAYDADQNVTSIVSYNASSSVIESFAYTYDRAGNLSSETDTQQGTPTTTTYTYDDANQLTGAGGSSYSYDANGNRTMNGYTTGAGNELTSDGTYDYTYDASGQEITKTDIATGDKWTYEYNSGGELTSAEEQTSLGAIENQISYEYDIFGQLIQEDANGTITEYAVDGWNPAKAGATGTSNFDVWATFTSGGSLISRQIQGDGVDQHLAFVTSSNAYWYLTDHLGSTRATINNSGTVQDSLVYDAYGNLTSQSNASAEPFYTYTGREVDVETGLQYNRARWYDPGTGRWITQDPLGFDAGDSNLYRYVTNAPTKEKDPSGLKPLFSQGDGAIGNRWWNQDGAGASVSPGAGAGNWCGNQVGLGGSCPNLAFGVAFVQGKNVPSGPYPRLARYYADQLVAINPQLSSANFATRQLGEKRNKEIFQDCMMVPADILKLTGVKLSEQRIALTYVEAVRLALAMLQPPPTLETTRRYQAYVGAALKIANAAPQP